MSYEYINYEYWRKVITRAQIGMAICVFIVEIVVKKYILTFAMSLISGRTAGRRDTGDG